jgi:segregation and condensation protein A
MNEQIFQMLVKEDEITWQTIIFDLVKKEEMNPWDIDLKILAQKFIGMVKQLKEMDFRISGRIILAAAILLRLKSSRLLEDDITQLDRLIAMDQTSEEEFYEDLQAEYDSGAILADGTKNDQFMLIPRTPQPRKRKISVYDLVGALNKALEVKVRREGRYIPIQPDVKAPENVVDMSEIIDKIYVQIKNYYSNTTSGQLKFSQLLPSDSSNDKVYTFIPLLHLTNQRKIDLEQKNHFGEIDINLTDNKNIIL